jgi:hypothetical protein
MRAVCRRQKENPPAQKEFLKNLGSNFFLKDRTLSFSYASPFHLVAKSDPIKNWLPLSDEIRTYFQGLYTKLEDRKPESI